MIVDIGTGDGLFVYHSARTHPDRFYIGIDPSARPLEKVSEKIHRKPAKGGAPNALYVRAAIEDLPSELDGVADEVHVHFPWGSLLAALSSGEPGALAALRRICSPGAVVEVVLGLDPSRDAGEIERLGLPSLSIDWIDEVLAPRYRDAGLEIVERGVLPHDEWDAIHTSWARRLGGREGRTVFYLIARAGNGGPKDGAPGGKPSDTAGTLSDVTESSLTIRAARREEAAMLAELGARAYRGAWGAMTAPDDLEGFVAETFRPERIAAELREEGATTLLALEGETPVGYAKLDTAPAPPEVAGERPLHLHRLYLDQGRSGGGIGSELMRAVLDLARSRGHHLVWLTVWEKNERGMNFYRRWGFERVGEEPFHFCSEVQRDFIYVLRVTADRAPD